MTLLQKSQKVLKEHAIELYTLNSDDIPLEKEEFKRHYSNLGEVLFEIDSIESFSQVISKLEKGDFEELGYHEDDEDLIEEFLKAVEKS